MNRPSTSASAYLDRESRGTGTGTGNDPLLRRIDPRRIGALLRADRVVQAALGLLLAAAAAQMLPLGDRLGWVVQNLFEAAFVLLMIGALVVGLDRLVAPERRFWKLLALGFTAWMAVYLLYLMVPETGWTLGFNVGVDALYLVLYVCFLLAVEIRADLPRGRREAGFGTRYRLPGAVVFSIGLFAYFVVIPGVVTESVYEDWWLSFGLFLALDLYLCGRLLVLSRMTRSPRWRFLYSLLSVTCGVFALSDLLEWMYVLDLLSPGEGVLAALVWCLPLVVPIVAVRLRHLEFESREGSVEAEARESEAEATGAPFFAYALVLPVIHFTAYRGGIFSAATESYHELFILGWLAVVGTVSFFQHLQIQESSASLADRRKLNEDRLWYRANFDSVTGLPNRVLFRDRLAHALKSARRDGRLVALVFIDLDRFKRVNDDYGHAVGDLLLRRVAERLVGCLRESDTVARYGGDEFTVILEALEEPAHADRLVQVIGLTLSEPFEIGPERLELGASLGVALSPRDGNDAESLLASADAAMYDGKRGAAADEARIRSFAGEASRLLRDRTRREDELRRAIDEEQLVCCYQPIWSLADGDLVGLEALVRWRHPKRGLLRPKEFMVLAERTGLITALGRWVMSSACRQAAVWRGSGHDVYLAVNLPAGEFRDASLPRTVLGILERAGLPAEALELDLTEATMMTDSPATARVAHELTSNGVRIAIDDFGSGASSLEYLTTLAPSAVKIPGGMIRELGADSRSEAMVGAIISLAHSLGIRVIAEGVENESQREFLSASGCDEVQGYLLGRPMPASELAAMLSNRADA